MLLNPCPRNWGKSKHALEAGGPIVHKGIGVFVPWRARDFVHFQLRGRGGRPQLNRDSLGGGGCPRCTLATG